MERYWVFCWSTYYPEGGMNDFKSDHDIFQHAVDAAEMHLAEECSGHTEVLDSRTGTMMYSLDKDDWK